LAPSTRFHVGVAVNPFGPNPESEWRRLDFKVEAGAEFIMTPPILDLDAFDGVSIVSAGRACRSGRRDRTRRVCVRPNSCRVKCRA
jgi:hypothetical protein